MKTRKWRLVVAVLVVASFGMFEGIHAQLRARDPGVRGGAAGAGGPIAGLTADEAEMFRVGLEDFSEEEGVSDGVGPRFNFVGCAGCHEQPAIGGTSPAVNPLFRVVDRADLGFTGNVIPSFISRDGPIREARLQYKPDGSRDGGVHALFVITGHREAGDCAIEQVDFERQIRNRNIVFRIPTPTFGAGLIEHVPGAALVANLNSQSSIKKALGISGRLNRNGNDGTITRFGWKAQNQSLLLFSGEAYNVEMGITNELFQQERDETPNCQYTKVPNDVTASVRSGPSRTSTTSSASWRLPGRRPIRPAERPPSSAAGSSSPTSAARSATHRRCRPATPR
jgi:hypothetical protein